MFVAIGMASGVLTLIRLRVMFWTRHVCLVELAASLKRELDDRRQNRRHLLSSRALGRMAAQTGWSKTNYAQGVRTG